MPTIAGMRRRGYTPKAIRNFCARIGVAKRNSIVDVALLEYCIREDLNRNARRVMAVLNPLKVIISNYPAGQVEELSAIDNPEDPTAGKRGIPFSRELYIEKDDFMEKPPKKFFRLAPGREVRLRYAYYITCEKVIKDESTGEIIELHCKYDPATRGGTSPDGRKVKSTLHWVLVEKSIPAAVRLYDRLFTKENPEDVESGQTYLDTLNPDSIKILSGCRVEPFIAIARSGERFQFERLGYFCVDSHDSSPDALVFNRTVTLRDAWAKITKSGK